MLIIPISTALLALVCLIAFFKSNRLVIPHLRILSVGYIIQVIVVAIWGTWQIKIGCPSSFGDCYVANTSVELLEIFKLVVVLCSWLYWLWLVVTSIRMVLSKKIS